MTLGERIYRLRTGKGLSQGDLAEKMNVSRQAISKWETDASIPDLDKLLLLSDFFQLSIDALVKGSASDAPPPQSEPPQGPKTPPERAGGTQKGIGLVLLAVGLFCAVLAFMFGPVILVPAAYLLLCGSLCLWVKRHAGLLIGWGTFLLVACLLPLFTSTRLSAILNLQYYKNGLFIQLFIAWALWILLFFLLFFTAKLVSPYLQKRK